MAYFEKFTEQEIPYGTLENFGLTQEMIDDLPQSVKNRLLTSRWTPVLPIVTEDEFGEKHVAYARIRLERMKDDTIDVIFAPYCGFDNLSNYDEEQQEKLRKGLVIIADVKTDEGSRQKCFVQFDKDTNQTMYVPQLMIYQNISILADREGLSADDRQTLQNGTVLEIEGNNGPVSIGIDLYDRTGIRIADGDRALWLTESQAQEIQKYNFGINGCWIADERGNLSYVRDDDFTEDMYREMDRQKLQNAAGVQQSNIRR